MYLPCCICSICWRRYPFSYSHSAINKASQYGFHQTRSLPLGKDYLCVIRTLNNKHSILRPRRVPCHLENGLSHAFALAFACYNKPGCRPDATHVSVTGEQDQLIPLTW